MKVWSKLTNPQVLGRVGAFVTITFESETEEAARSITTTLSKMTVEVPSRTSPDCTELKLLSVQFCGTEEAAKESLEKNRQIRQEKSKQFKEDHADVAGRAASRLNLAAQCQMADSLAASLLFPSRKRPR